MKPLNGISITLCLFGLSAGLAWLTGSPAQRSGASAPLVPVLRGAVEPSDSSPSQVIANFEEELLRGPERAGDEHCSREEARVCADKFMFGNSMDPFGPNEGLAYVDSWSREDPEAVFEWIERRGFMPGLLETDQSRVIVSILFQHWIEEDREQALAAALRFSRTAHRAQALALVLQNLWRSDPACARGLIA
ncbi:MAG TPA: hypothetical protein VHM91_21140, partial [Verrucomicrobiales bacterium]|nr:hypothetical protein [Verrucomicrobiales bacterium]